jgi:hypothetical protein
LRGCLGTRFFKFSSTQVGSEFAASVICRSGFDGHAQTASNVNEQRQSSVRILPTDRLDDPLLEHIAQRIRVERDHNKLNWQIPPMR